MALLGPICLHSLDCHTGHTSQTFEGRKSFSTVVDSGTATQIAQSRWFAVCRLQRGVALHPSAIRHVMNIKGFGCKHDWESASPNTCVCVHTLNRMQGRPLVA